MKPFSVLFLLLLAPCLSNAWDGYDTETGASVQIEKGNMVREGSEIEYYDYNKGEYKNVEVQNIERSGSEVEVEIYDYESGEYGTLIMEDD
jgi:hypothetical protein